MNPNEPPLTQLGRALTEVDELKTTVEGLTRVLNTERATTRRFRANMAGLVVLLVLNLIGITFTYQAAHRAKDVSETLQDCLVVGGKCYEQLARSGTLGSNRLIDFNACFFLIAPDDRLPADKDKCKKLADDAFFDNLKQAQEEVPK